MRKRYKKKLEKHHHYELKVEIDISLCVISGFCQKQIELLQTAIVRFSNSMKFSSSNQSIDKLIIS
jgi:hypothetical protein